MVTRGWIVKRITNGSWVYLVDFGGTDKWSSVTTDAHVFARKYNAETAAHCFSGFVATAR